MPIWYEYRDANDQYVSREIVEQSKKQDEYTLVECYAKEYPENSGFSFHGYIRSDLKSRVADEGFNVEKFANGKLSSAPAKDLKAAKVWVKGADAFRITTTSGALIEEKEPEILKAVNVNSFSVDHLVATADGVVKAKRNFYD